MISEFVAFIVGGNNKNVELYSPDGNCQHTLKPIPNGAFEPILAYIEEMILACGGRGNTYCYLYHPNNDTWSHYSTSTFLHNEQPGEIYNGKIFIANERNPEVFDPVSNTWSSWLAPYKRSGDAPCLVAWKDVFFLIGGEVNKRGIQIYNHSSNTWDILNSSSTPMDILYSGCILLPNEEEILVVSSHDAPFKSSAALYNIKSNTWRALPDTPNPRDAATLVALGKRVFAIDGHAGNIIEEFDYANSTWMPIKAKLNAHRDGHPGVISLPAEKFQHLPGGCVGVQ